MLACAGKYRTGKSYLLNRLSNNRAGGFRVGETVQSCTKGICLYKKVLRSEHCAYIVIDTEGIDALDADSTHDVRIFTLWLLLSSMFIYNSVGAIDETGLQTLGLMAKVSECVRVSANDEEGGGVAALAKYFPHFVWVLRDFTLRLTDRDGAEIGADAYLDSALASRDGASSDRENVRCHLRDAFRWRSLFTLPRPASDDHLARIDSTPQHVAPAFDVKLADLKSFVMDHMHALRPGGTPLTGPMYAAYCQNLVGNMGGDRVPVIRDAWSLMEEIQQRDCRDAALAALRQAVEDARASKLSPRRAEAGLAAAAEAALGTFRQAVRQPGAADRLRAELQEIIRVEVERVRASDLEMLELHIDGLGVRIDAAGGGLPAVLSLVQEATRQARDQAHDDEWVERWHGALLAKLLRAWLPAAGDQAAQATAQAQADGELHRAAALRLEAEVRDANLRCEDVLRDARASVEAAKKSLANDLAYARELLEAERQCTEEQRARLAEMEARLLAAPPPRAAAPDSPREEDEGEEAAVTPCGCCEEHELRRASAERLLEETRASLESDLAAALERDARTLAQLERIREGEAQAGREFAGRIEAMRAENAAAVDKIRAAAQKSIAELEEECEMLRADAKRLRDEATALRVSGSALGARCEEAAAGFAREVSRLKESEARAHAATAELQERVLAAHRETLEDSRARNSRLRKEHEARSAELLELHGKLSSALVEAEHTRGNTHRLKRRLQEVQDLETEVKRLRRLDDDKGSRLTRYEVELREARSRREEVTREREELRAQLMDLERALAAANRELQMERARVRAD